MKKLLTLCFGLLISVSVFTGCRKKPETLTPDPTPRPRRADKNVNQEPLDNRPYVRLIPKADGRSITLEIAQMKKKAGDVEYEIEYSSGSLLQGAFGSIADLDDLPVTKDILLGSCSSGGKCTYNTNVTGGTLTLRFGNPEFTFKQEWSYAEKAKTTKVFSSRDGKLSLDVSKAKNNAPTLLVYHSPGFPGTVQGTVITGPYVVAASGGITGSVTVSLRLPAGKEEGTLIAYDGSSWKTLKSTIRDRMVTATGELADVYLLVGK